MAIREVIDQLSRLNELHNVMLELGEAKKQVLIDNRVDELSKIVNQETKLVKSITENERQWLEAMARFLQDKGFSTQSAVTVSDLAKKVFHVEDRQALMEAQQQLMETIRKLQEINALNQQLIQQSLAFVDYSLDLLTGAPEEDLVYRMSSQQKPTKRSGIFDTRA